MVKTTSRPEGCGDDKSRIWSFSNSESGEIVGPSKVFSQQETAGEKGRVKGEGTDWLGLAVSGVRGVRVRRAEG